MKGNGKKEFLRAVKFSLISLSAGLIELGTFELFDKVFHWTYWVCHIISITLSVIWNFTINRKYTFKSANNIKIAMLLVALFYVVFIPLSTFLGNLCANNGVNDDVIKIVTLLCNFVLEFLYTRFIVYRNSCDTAVKKGKNKNIESAGENNCITADELTSETDCESVAVTEEKGN